MDQPIQRNGSWWHQQPDGSWLKWNTDSNAWEPVVSAPPPPTPPTARPAPGAPTFADLRAAQSEPVVEVPAEPVTAAATPTNGAPTRANGELFADDGSEPVASSLGRYKSVIASVVLVGMFALGGYFAMDFFTGGEDPAAAPTNPASTHETMSPAQHAFITKADAICAATATKVKKLGTPSTATEVVVFAHRSRALHASMMRKLLALKAPKSDRAVVRRLFVAGKGLGTYLVRVERAARAGNMAGVQKTLGELQSRTTKLNGRLAAYGFGACAR
jgi:hypothetical protein